MYRRLLTVSSRPPTERRSIPGTPGWSSYGCFTRRSSPESRLPLSPGQSFRLPARRIAAMAFGVHRPLEPVRDIVGVRKPSRLRGLRRGHAADARAAEEVDAMLR